MVGLPRLHGKLGAKRVEVTAREAAGKEIGRVSLKTCQQQHVGSLGRSTNQIAPKLRAGVFQGRAAGVGQPFTVEFGILDLRFLS